MVNNCVSNYLGYLQREETWEQSEEYCVGDVILCDSACT